MLALAAVTMAAAACAPRGGTSSGSTPAALLSDREIHWHARLLAMTDAVRPDTNLIDSALATGSPHVRRVAALSIGQVGAASRSARLQVLLADPDTGVAASAAFALGVLRDSTAVGPLAASLRTSPTVAIDAAWALGEIGAPARTAIIGELSSVARGAAYHAELLRAAARLRPVPVEEIAAWLDVGGAVRTAAAYALGRSAPPAAVRHHLAIAADTAATRRDPAPHETLASVARGLSVAAAGDSLDTLAVVALRGLVKHAHPHVRINALRSLGTYGARARTVVMDASRDPDANVRIAAAQAAGTVIDSASRDWDVLWAADTGHAWRATVLASAARRGAVDEVLRLGAPWERHGEWRFRAARAAALAAAPSGARRDAALAAARVDPDSRVRIAAVSVLADSTAPPDARARLVTIAGGDPDPFVRGAALAALQARVGGGEVPAVLAAYRRAAADSVNDARMAAITLLAAAWRRDSASIAPGIAAELRALPPPGDPLERLAGRAAPIFAHWPGAEGTPRPIAWYEERIRAYVAPALAGRPRTAELETVRGTITIELAGADAPLTVNNFVTLVRAGFYRGARFHRVVPNFVAQDGDPRGDGNGGPGYAIRDELNRLRYGRGAVGMALSGPHTGGSQYFLTHSPQPHLDGHYTVFGRVIAGWSALDAVVQGDEILRIRVR